MAVLQSDGVNHTSDLILRRNGTEGLRLTSSTVQVSSINDGPLAGFRNRIINGDMQISERAGGAQVSGNGAFPVNRFRFDMVGGGVINGQRSTISPIGFTNSVSLTTGTADTSIASTDIYNFQQRIEGSNIYDFNLGNASAITFTLSFWVRSSIAGTYSGGVNNSAADRSYVFTYNINSANTWEYKTLTIPGDTSGSWTTDSEVGIRLLFDLGSGSTFHGTANTWNTGNKFRTSSSVNWIATSGSTFYITGVQLEPGPVATPFERRPFGTELALCHRYFQIVGAGSIGRWVNNDICELCISGISHMRGGVPNVELSTTTNLMFRIGLEAFNATGCFINQILFWGTNGMIIQIGKTGGGNVNAANNEFATFVARAILLSAEI
jgi:hypothetical protein